MKNQPTILIVDDHASAREVLEGMLSEEGYQLASAENGPQALQMAAKLNPDLILLDVMMPNMDGFEVCQRLRTTPEIAEVPVLMVTALNDRHALLRGIEAGADDFIAKPFDHSELKARVRTITRLNRYKRLLAERTKFEWVVEHAEHGYVMINERDEILYANPTARSSLGLGDEGEKRGQSFRETAVSQYQLQPAAAWGHWPAAPPHQQARYLVRPETATSKAFWLMVNTLQSSVGKEAVWIVRLQDVTAKMAAQHEMFTFHRIVSHKLRTPLNWIVGPLSVLVADPDAPREDIAEFAQLAYDGAVRLQNIVDDVLQYANLPFQVEQGGSCHLSQIQSLVAKVNTDLKLENILVTTTADAAKRDLQMALSPFAAELILSELLENAQKFHPQQQPKVVITLSLADDQQVQIKLEDNGTTLSPKQLDRAWRPYDQGEKYLTGETAGMGLGLPTVAYLVWSVGGTCEISNQPQGTGVVVDLTIPLVGEVMVAG